MKLLSSQLRDGWISLKNLEAKIRLCIFWGIKRIWRMRGQWIERKWKSWQRRKIYLLQRYPQRQDRIWVKCLEFCVQSWQGLIWMNRICISLRWRIWRVLHWVWLSRTRKWRMNLHWKMKEWRQMLIERIKARLMGWRRESLLLWR